MSSGDGNPPRRPLFWFRNSPHEQARWLLNGGNTDVRASNRPVGWSGSNDNGQRTQPTRRTSSRQPPLRATSWPRPVASQLSADPSSINRRCVLGWFDFIRLTACVTTCRRLCKAERADDLAFLDRNQRRCLARAAGKMMYGRLTAVPPLHEALPALFLATEFYPGAIRSASIFIYVCAR
jgi:hypothetical protein